MKIHEDRSHMNIDTRWFEKGYAKEDVHSLRLQSLCTEAEAAANKQFYDSHTREEWEQYIRGNETHHGSHRTGLCLQPV